MQAFSEKNISFYNNSIFSSAFYMMEWLSAHKWNLQVQYIQMIYIHLT